jgi:hypothetical protein
MTIAYVAGTTGPNSSSTSETLSMPTGYNTAGNITIAAFCNQGSLTITPPSGWTTIASGLGWWIGYRVYVSGDASSITATVSTSGTFWMSAAACYSGVDNTNPVDAANWFVQLCLPTSITPAPTPLVRAPSLNPSYTNDQLVVFLMGCNDTGGTFTFPGGLTQRQSNVAGPCMAVLDTALTSTAATGNYNGAISNAAATEPQIGVQIALKAAASTSGTLAVANVTQGGLIFGANNNVTPSTSVALALGALGLKTGDLIVVALTTGQSSTGALISAPSGYSGIQTTSYSGIYTHTWTGSGDNATPTFTLSPAAYATFSVSVLRAGGTGTISVDTSFFGTTGGNTAPSPSLTPASTNEMLLVHFTAQNVSAGTWSSTPGGLTLDANVANGPSLLMGWVEPVSSPTGSFSATNTEPVVAWSTLIKVTPPPAVVRPPQQMCLT